MSFGSMVLRLKMIFFDIFRNKNIRIGKGTKINKTAIIDLSYGGSIEFGENCEVGHGVMVLSYGGKISIGNAVSLNPYCVLYGHGNLEIGDGVRIAAQTVIIPANHNYQNRNEFIYQQGERCLGINIEEDVWIGTGCKILDGVTIRKGTIIAAGAVVTKSTEPYGIYAGVPARKIKER